MTATVAPVESWIDYDAGTVVIAQAADRWVIPLDAYEITWATANRSDSGFARLPDGSRIHRDAVNSPRSLVDGIQRCPARYGRRVCERHVLDINETHCPSHRKA